MPTTAFGSHLRGFLERRGLSQAALARDLGISQNAISQYVNGKTLPSRGVLLRLRELADQEMRLAVDHVLDSGGVKLRSRASRIEKKLNVSGDLGGVLEQWRVARTALVEALADVFLGDPDPSVAAIVQHLIERPRTEAFARQLKRAAEALEESAPISRAEVAAPAGDEFLRIMKRFQEIAPPEEFAMLRRQAQNVIAIEERRRERERRKLNEGLAG